MEQGSVDLIFPLVEYDDFPLFIRDCSFQDVFIILLFLKIDAKLYEKSSFRCLSYSSKRDYSS